jgi:hypothetical protein
MVLGVSGPAPDGMDVQAMNAWLTALGDAWEQGDADAAAALFAPGATFQPSPFGDLVRPQAARQLGPQRTPALHEQRLIDRLVGHPHLPLVRMIVAQLPGDLLGRPARLEQPLDVPAQGAIAGELGAAWSAGPGGGAHLGQVGPVPAPASVARHLARDGRGRPAGRTAIRRSDSPPRRPRLISSRSAIDRRRLERTLSRGGTLPSRAMMLWIVRVVRPMLVAMLPNGSPVATRRRISSRSACVSHRCPRLPAIDHLRREMVSPDGDVASVA